jgi:hypothetical protein
MATLPCRFGSDNRARDRPCILWRDAIFLENGRNESFRLFNAEFHDCDCFPLRQQPYLISA